MLDGATEALVIKFADGGSGRKKGNPQGTVNGGGEREGRGSGYYYVSSLQGAGVGI